jgi:hypothetical protein
LPTVDVVLALVAVYTERAETQDRRLIVGFFGGAPPPQSLIEAIGGVPFIARVRPDLLSRADADRLVAAGCIGIELAAFSFDGNALRSARRLYTPSLVKEQARGLAKLGVEVGLVLAPGLPRSSHQSCLRDAEIAGELADTVRLHPVLVLDRAALRSSQQDGQYTPLGIGDAVTVCREMLDILEGLNVSVIRIGQQPGPDEMGRAVAGPKHSSLRELVEARRALDALTALMHEVPPGAKIAIRCAPADVSRVRGPRNQHMRTLRADHQLSDVEVRPDPELERGNFFVEVA